MKVFSHSAPLCMLAGMLVASPALGVQLVSNGPFITNPGAHASGEDVSLAQDVTYSGYTALGFNAGPDYRLADDFSVPPGHYWTIDSARLFAYQTGAGDAPFTDARVIIWQGQPDGFGSIKLFDGTVSNNLVSSTPGAYRTAQSFGATMFSDTARRIHTLETAITPLLLGPGGYWIDWQVKGPTPTSAVFTPPVSILGQANTFLGGFPRLKCPSGITDPEDECFGPTGQWILFNNGTSSYVVDLPFELHGTDVIDAIFETGFETPPATP